MVVTLGQQYNIGEKPTVILYTYINRHAGTPEKQRKNKKQKNTIKHGSKDSVAIAIRSLKDRFVTIVSLTLLLI